MLALRYPARWRFSSKVLLALVLAAALAPLHLILPAAPGPAIPHLDKWLHGIAFLALAIWFAGQYARHYYWRLAAGLAGFGLGIELMQRMVSYRTADWLDFVADVAGLGVGLAIAVAGLGGWSVRVESWLLDRRG